MKYGFLLGVLYVGACAPHNVVTCPHIVTYSAQDQKNMAQELQKSPPMTVRFIEDYAALRAQVRACQTQE